MPELAHAARPDVIMATGRSDYPNQVNNALCFPYIFRGALDVGATIVNEEMKIACVHAIATMAHTEVSLSETDKNTESKQFGREYLIPGPLEPNLILNIAPAVAKAAMDSGVATLPIEDFDAYRQTLSEFVYNSALAMKPVFTQAKQAPKRIVYAEGEDANVLRAVQVVVDENMAQPIIIGRPDVIEAKIKELGLRLTMGEHVEVVDINNNPKHEQYWQHYHQANHRLGVSAELARRDMRRKSSLLGAMMVEQGDADGLLCGTFGYYDLHLNYIRRVIGKRQGVSDYYAMSGVILQDRTLFIADPYIHENPTAAQIAEMTVLAAQSIRRFGVEPRVALLSHSDFGTSQRTSAVKMREAYQILCNMNVDFEFDGEMHGDAALDVRVREQSHPFSTLHGSANLLIMPTLDAAHIAFNLLKSSSGSSAIGPILLGADKPVHILVPASTARRIVNMTAIVVTDAQKVDV